MIWKQRPHDERREEMLLKQGKAKLLSRLLAQRNINPDSADDFISSEYEKMSHPFTLHDCEKAAKIFLEVVKNKGSVTCLVDYDVDGVLSGVMLKELCNVFDLECRVFLPSRYDHGYGLNDRSVKDFMEKYPDPSNLLIVADCGTNNKDQIEKLKAYGIKQVIVIDHHLQGNKDNISTNADALVSWHFGGTCEMCAAGEIYQFIRGIHQLNRKVSPVEFLTYAAVATIADVSPIISDNRIIVKNGLTSYAINHVVASGLISLMKQSKIYAPVLTQEAVSFKIAPKINAAGRIDSPDIVYSLFTERDPEIASQMADFVAGYNDQRKVLQKEIEAEAIEIGKKHPETFTHGMLVCNSRWKIGVVGIVASRLTEEFNMPALVIGNYNGTWKGSGRSIKGVNIKEILDKCPELFVTYGGHAGAVGCAIRDDKIDKAGEIFNDACRRYFEENKISIDACSLYDAKVDAKIITPKTAEMLSQNLYPYCEANNSEPVFMLPDATIYNFSTKEGAGWKLASFNAERKGVTIEHPFKTFNGKFNQSLEGKKVDILFTFPQIYEKKPNEYSNNFELFVVDIVEK